MSKRLTRRRFSQAGVAAGLSAFAAPFIVPSRAFGANDRVTFGMIGVGNQGRHLLKQFGSRAQCVAISDAYLPRAEEIAASIGVKYVYHDYRKMLERKDMDAVVIATPHHWHAIHTIDAAQAGKDIYCEKPLSYTVEEGRRMVEAVRKHRRVLQTGLQQRSGSREYRGCMHVRNGSIGAVKRVLATAYNTPMELGDFSAQPIPDGLDWDMWCGPTTPPPFHFGIWDNRTKPSWVSVRPFSGGQMCDWGAHGLDMAQWGLGMDEAGPVEIWTEGEPYQPKTSSEKATGGRHDGVHDPKVCMKYPSGTVMELAGGPGGFGVHFEGQNGRITVARGKFQSSIKELANQDVKNPKVQLYRSENHYDNWIECIKTRHDPAANVEIGHRTTTVCHLGNIARWVSEITGETGRKLKWDSRAERFTNSEQANKFLQRTYRKGYELPEV